MSVTARLNLPFLAAGQAQKELVHNEALQVIDLLVAANVAEPPRNDPPTTPAIGTCYIIGTAPTGGWAGKPSQLAGWTSGGWRYIAPVEGMRANVQSTGLNAVYRGGVWESGVVRATSISIGANQVVGGRQAAIADPSGGTTVDSQGRSAVGQILLALRQHGLIAP